MCSNKLLQVSQNTKPQQNKEQVCFEVILLTAVEKEINKPTHHQNMILNVDNSALKIFLFFRAMSKALRSFFITQASLFPIKTICYHSCIIELENTITPPFPIFFFFFLIYVHVQPYSYPRMITHLKITNKIT